MNFERKMLAKSVFTDSIWIHKSNNLKISARSFQVGVRFHPGRSQPDTFINSFYAMNSHFNNDGPWAIHEFFGSSEWC